MRIKITNSQSNVMAPILADYPSADLKSSVLNVPDDDAAQCLDILREGHAKHTGNTGERRALAIAIRKLAEAINGPESHGEATDAPAEGGDTGQEELNGWLPATGELGAVDHTAKDHDKATCPECTAEKHTARIEEKRAAARKHAAKSERYGDMPDRLAAVLRAIEDNGYGANAKTVLRNNPRRDGEAATRWAARLRHACYLNNADKAGDNLQAIPAGV